MLKYHKNELGLIFKVTGEHDPGELGTGDSVCNTCGKIMKGCWDVVCSKCDKTFCYDCAEAGKEYWYCRKDYSVLNVEEYFSRTNVR